MSKNSQIFRLAIPLALMLPMFAHAADLMELMTFAIDGVAKIIPILVSLAVLMFFWGLVKFIAHADEPDAIKEGKNVMIWGMIALFVMVSLWALVGYLQESLGLNVSGMWFSQYPMLPNDLPTPR